MCSVHNMAENKQVVELFRNSDSDQNTNSAAKSKVGVSIIKTEIVEESNNSALELDGRNTPSDLIAVKNEDNSELKLENIIADSNNVLTESEQDSDSDSFTSSTSSSTSLSSSNTTDSDR